MSNMQPKGEQLKKAVSYISEKRKLNLKINQGELVRLVDEASLQFDLSPKDSQFLLRFVKDDYDQNST
jgi:hypothetical protein